MATMDIVEIVRLLRAGESDRTITQVVRCNRRTVAKYRAWAAHDLLTGAMPTSAALHRLLAQTLPGAAPPQQVSTVAPYAEEIAAYRVQGLELAAIRARLEETHGHPVSYHALWRLVRHLEPRRVEAVVRVEVKPGSEAQVDFGSAGLLLDSRSGAPRKAWVFVLVLSWSRHMYAELVFDQRVETWLRCHQHAFESWGGTPARIVPDNLKAAIVRASFTEPLAQRAYRECAEHYDFLIDPNPPRSPHLKGKVEADPDSARVITEFPVVPLIGYHESGLTGIALDPDFENNGLIYCHYTHHASSGGIENRVARIRKDGTEREVILDGMPGGRVLNGGILAFGPDGHCWENSPYAPGEEGMPTAGRPAMRRSHSYLLGTIYR
jgi:transposase